MSFADAAPVIELTGRARRRRLLRKRFLRRPFAILGPSSGKHLLGTDELGHDVFSSIVWGSRASIEAGVLATLLAMAIAVPIGGVAGGYPRVVDPVIARLTDVLLA